MYKGIKEAIKDYRLNSKYYKFEKLKYSDDIILRRKHHKISYSNTSLLKVIISFIVAGSEICYKYYLFYKMDRIYKKHKHTV
jgi:hypothetical protein